MTLLKKVKKELPPHLAKWDKYIQKEWNDTSILDSVMEDSNIHQDCSQCLTVQQCPEAKFNEKKLFHN